MTKIWKIAAVSAAVLGATIAGSTSAVAATHYTATSCSGHSSGGMCLRGPGGLNAWDARPKDNRTLNDWAYPDGQEIATHLTSVTIYATSCNVEFFQGTGFGGKFYEVYGSANGAVTKSIPSGYTYSFEWFCPA